MELDTYDPRDMKLPHAHDGLHCVVVAREYDLIPCPRCSYKPTMLRWQEDDTKDLVFYQFYCPPFTLCTKSEIYVVCKGRDLLQGVRWWNTMPSSIRTSSG